MRAVTKPRLTEPACSFDTLLSSLGRPAPAFVGIPRTLREQVGARQFGDFGTVLMAERPASADLSNRVERWRVVEVAADDDLPLRPHRDQTAEDHRFNVLFVITPILIVCWVIIGLISAWLGGVL